MHKTGIESLWSTYEVFEWKLVEHISTRASEREHRLPPNNFCKLPVSWNDFSCSYHRVHFLYKQFQAFFAFLLRLRLLYIREQFVPSRPVTPSIDSQKRARTTNPKNKICRQNLSFRTQFCLISVKHILIYTVQFFNIGDIWFENSAFIWVFYSYYMSGSKF